MVPNAEALQYFQLSPLQAEFKDSKGNTVIYIESAFAGIETPVCSLKVIQEVFKGNMIAEGKAADFPVSLIYNKAGELMSVSIHDSGQYSISYYDKAVDVYKDGKHIGTLTYPETTKRVANLKNLIYSKPSAKGLSSYGPQRH